MKNFITLSFILLFTSLSFSQLDEQKKLEFSKKMKDGDMLFSQGKFLEAKKTYENAHGEMHMEGLEPSTYGT